MGKAYICDGCGELHEDEPVQQDKDFAPKITTVTGKVDTVIYRLHRWPDPGSPPLPDLCEPCWKRVIRAIADGSESLDLTLREEN